MSQSLAILQKQRLQLGSCMTVAKVVHIDRDAISVAWKQLVASGGHVGIPLPTFGALIALQWISSMPVPNYYAGSSPDLIIHSSMS